MKRRLLITGSGGMLGMDLCRELAGDYDIFGLDVVSRAATPVLEDPRLFKCDITKGVETLRCVSDVKADVVVHAAAWTDVDGCELDPGRAYAVNGDGAANVAAGCEKAGSLLVYLSTDFVFDGRKAAPYLEDDGVNPLSVYAKSKLKGEEAIRGITDRYYILRTSWLFGKDGKNFVDTIVDKARREPRLKVVNDQVGSPTYTKDLAKAIRRLLDKISVGKGGFGIYHVSNSGSVSWFDYARTILTMKGLAAAVEPITSEELDRPAERPCYSVLDNSKFIAFTGYRMRPWEDALKDYLTDKG